jgi:hypothetical protein
MINATNVCMIGMNFRIHFWASVRDPKGNIVMIVIANLISIEKSIKFMTIL